MGKDVRRAGFYCQQCGTAYHVRTETAPYNPADNTARCEDCGKVMATWFSNVRPVYSKRERQPG